MKEEKRMKSEGNKSAIDELFEDVKNYRRSDLRRFGCRKF